MEEGTGEVTVRHLETVVESPQGRDKGITDAREPAARRRVRLEHHELLAHLLRGRHRAQILRDEIFSGVVREVVRDDVLRVYRVAEAGVGEGGGAVVVRVPGCDVDEKPKINGLYKENIGGRAYCSTATILTAEP